MARRGDTHDYDEHEILGSKCREVLKLIKLFVIDNNAPLTSKRRARLHSLVKVTRDAGDLQ